MHDWLLYALIATVIFHAMLQGVRWWLLGPRRAIWLTWLGVFVIIMFAGYYPFMFGGARLDDGNNATVILMAAVAGGLGLLPALVTWIVARFFPR